MIYLPCLFMPPVGFSMHFYMLAYMFMHESCLLMCRPCFNTIKLLTFDPNLHLSLVDTTFYSLICLFAFSLVCLLSRSLLAMSIMLICFMSPSYALCIFSFPLLVCWFLVFAFAYTHMERGHMELGHGLPSASKRSEDTSMQIWAKLLCLVGLGVQFFPFDYVLC